MAQTPFKSIYVLHGHDAFLRRQKRQEIVRAFVGDENAELIVSPFDPDAELATVLDELRTPSFLAPRRLVVIDGADDFVSKYRTQLETYLDHPSSSGSLLLTVDSWPGNTRIAKKAAEIGQVEECSAPPPGDLPKTVIEFAAARGKKIARPAAVLLAEYVGADLAKLDSEVEKLCLYAGTAPEITQAHVEESSIASAGPADYALINAIRDGNTAAALDALHGTITRKGEEFRVLGGLIWQYRKQLSGKGGPPPQWQRGGSPPARPAPTRPGAKLPVMTPRQVLRLLLQTDLALKSGADAALSMETLIVRLCGK